MDYTIFYKSKPSSLDMLSDLGRWDVFISAFNKTDRVKKVFESVNSRDKYWLVQREYDLSSNDIPADSKAHFATSYSESKIFNDFFSESGASINYLKNKRLCIDSTGFMRPHLMYLIMYLYKHELKRFHILYSEPSHYTKKEDTEFSKGAVTGVRPVHGFESTSNRDVSKDLLVIGAGFDQDLILEVDEDKEHARKIQIVGFPSLQADMYQQCRLRIYKGSDEADSSSHERSISFAPANDPFVTATVLSDLVRHEENSIGITNLYLSPIGTKAQTIGFVLYFINECMEGKRDGCMIFPFSESYSSETSQGISKVWSFFIELP